MKKLILLLLSSLMLTACPAEQNDTSQTEAQTETPPSGVATETEAPVTTEMTGGDAIAGKQVFLSKTCTVCHKVSGVPEAIGVLGPALDNIGNVAATRIAGLDAAAYIQQSIEKPDAHLVEGFQNVMTPKLKETMTEAEFNNLVAYLMSLKS